MITHVQKFKPWGKKFVLYQSQDRHFSPVDKDEINPGVEKAPSNWLFKRVYTIQYNFYTKWFTSLRPGWKLTFKQSSLMATIFKILDAKMQAYRQNVQNNIVVFFSAFGSKTSQLCMKISVCWDSKRVSSSLSKLCFSYGLLFSAFSQTESKISKMEKANVGKSGIVGNCKT